MNKGADVKREREREKEKKKEKKRKKERKKEKNKKHNVSPYSKKLFFLSETGTF